jgi:hypothetical protein
MIRANRKMLYSFLMIFSAANLASASDAKSSGVTKLDVVWPRMEAPDCRCGVMAARQCPGRRS